MLTKIQPVRLFRSEATLLRINGVMVNSLGEGGRASISCSLLEEQNLKVLANEVVILEGDAYSAWGSDDEYVINYVLDSLGLNRPQEEVNSSATVPASDTVVDATSVDEA